MSTAHPDPAGLPPPRGLPLLRDGDLSRPLAWRDGRPVPAGSFLLHVQRVADVLPKGATVVNLCEDRYAFLVAFCAALVAGRTNLLPPSRAPQAVTEVMAEHPGCIAVGERALAPEPPGYVRLPSLDDLPDGVGVAMPHIDAGHAAAINYTSGSTGQPQPNTKTWGAFRASSAGTLAMLGAALGGSPLHLVATVPPQHMYGLETSVLLPLAGAVAVHAGRPFFPADIANALAEVPPPRVLVTTPVHLRSLLASGEPLPPLAALLSATAPMPVELAREAEARFGAPLLEIFGSTETCMFATRRPAREATWSLCPGVRLRPQPDGTLVEAPQLPHPVVLADLVELVGERGFVLRGRNTDLLEIAGKRASLGDLNRRLLAIPGVIDGVVFQLGDADAMGVRRIAALTVAPGLDAATVLAHLRSMVDPVFLPRPLRCVEALPRNETGKLPRRALLELLRR